MKKMLLFTLLAVLLFQAAPDYAASKDADTFAPPESQILRIKTLFDIKNPTAFKVEGGETKYADGGKLVYYDYSWTVDGKDLYLTTDDQGNIFTYSAYDENVNDPAPVLSAAAIEKIATDFLNKVDPKLATQYRKDNLSIHTRENSAELTYVRYVNDLPVVTDLINLSVSFAKSSVVQFTRTNSSAHYSDSVFPNPKDAMDKTAAFKLLTEINPFARHTLILKSDTLTTLPIYTHITDKTAIDATTGQLVDSTKILNAKALGYDRGGSDGLGASALDPVEVDNLDVVKQLKSKKDIEAWVKQHFDVKDMTVESGHYRQNADKNYVYAMSWSSDDHYMSIDVDAKDLTLLSLYNEGDTDKAPLSEAEAIKAAEAFMAQFPSKLNLANPLVETQDTHTIVRYPRLEGDAYVKDEGLELSIQNASKTVSVYRLEATRTAFTTPTAKLSQDDATAKALEQWHLMYAYVGAKPVLLYNYDGDYLFHGDTGTLLDNAGNALTDRTIAYDNLDASPYKDDIKALNDVSIGFYSIRDLKQMLTVGDFFELIQTIEGDHSRPVKLDDYKYRFNIPDVTEDSPLTESKAVELLMNYQGFSDLKNKADVWQSSTFKNGTTIPKAAVPYYYLAKSQGYLRSDTVNPTTNLTAEMLLHLTYGFVFIEQ
ncbi:hypothetical protein O6R05_01135 [Peptoniphilus equinus]|uniref:YcdB/YcdC repeated domain-containing protein n=1 Tax=Peptoniphilus equinus TaxID=3016343 RepID=A0ABY7QTU0_9FIRM|nr:YcdB/YcdC domain-containing protein [Peptoniphilus equinus]WBW50192.1 hypothetical protein O6R05_01135 [Peptoniphilus equinus]